MFPANEKSEKNRKSIRPNGTVLPKQCPPSLLESMYNDYVQNPDGIDQEYRKFFDGFTLPWLLEKMGAPAKL